MKKKKTKWFTVILLYPDYATDDFGADVSVRWVRVEAGKNELSLAAMAARKQCIDDVFRFVPYVATRHGLLLDMIDGDPVSGEALLEPGRTEDNASGEFGDPPGSDLRAIAVLEGRRTVVADATDGL